MTLVCLIAVGVAGEYSKSAQERPIDGSAVAELPIPPETIGDPEPSTSNGSTNPSIEFQQLDLSDLPTAPMLAPSTRRRSNRSTALATESQPQPSQSPRYTGNLTLQNSTLAPTALLSSGSPTTNSRPAIGARTTVGFLPAADPTSLVSPSSQQLPLPLSLIHI